MKLPEIPFEKYTLPNGLQVILHEDHSISSVAVNVWYHVGSKNEKRGRTGFAHLFEHMMFEGSKHNPNEYFELLEKVGANLNGSTSEDRTNYWEHLPANYLELALWMESDRMGFLLPAMDQKKLDNQIGVVKNERRQRYENQPYGRVYETMLEALYPHDHPYSWPVIGSMEDITAATLDDVKAFFQRFYTPNNASLCIAGDFEPARAKDWVEQYFGDIPPGPPLERIKTWIPKIDGKKRMEMRDRVALPRIYMAWHTPPLFKDGDAELDTLANILSSGKNSRLYKSLVYEKQIAQDVGAVQSSNEIGSIFEVIVTAKPGHSNVEIETAIETEMQNILQTPPSKQEVETVINGWEARYIRLLQSVGGFGGKADLLNQYNMFIGEPNYFQDDLNRYANVTAESVQSYAREFIRTDRQVVLHVDPENSLKAKTNSRIDRNIKPTGREIPKLKIPHFEEVELTNGLKLIVVERNNLPLVQFSLVLKTGWDADDPAKPGVSNLTSDLLDEGTSNRSTLQISQDLKSIGAVLSSSSSFDSSGVSLNVLKRHLDKGLDIYSDVILNPIFPDEELTRKKKDYLARIMQEKNEPFISSVKAFLRKLYGNTHPYGQSYTGSGTEESIQAISTENLKEFYQNYYRPNNAVLIVVGDIDKNQVVQNMEKIFGNWQMTDLPLTEIPPFQPIEKSKIYIVDKPGAVQSIICMGHYGQPRNSPDYYKLDVMNTLLGGKFTSRINMNLREDKGFTYGARSMFNFRKEIGPFLTYAPVHTENTAESITELLKEFRGIRGEKPVTEDEIKDTKNNLILSYPREFETIGKIAGNFVEMVTYNLAQNTLEEYIPQIESITPEDVIEVAKKHIRPHEIQIVVVGEREKIEPGLNELNIGEIGYLDAEGNEIDP
ncbi:insulinase family protein [candidate division KSB1 bacterium]|nr:insulinase family protein [candidate division KSB1 bacterium]